MMPQCNSYFQKMVPLVEGPTMAAPAMVVEEVAMVVEIMVVEVVVGEVEGTKTLVDCSTLVATTVILLLFGSQPD